jgi:hypothetical protein
MKSRVARASAVRGAEASVAVTSSAGSGANDALRLGFLAGKSMNSGGNSSLGETG